MTSSSGIHRPSLAALRPGTSAAALRNALGDAWTPPRRRDEGWVFGMSNLGFSARIDCDDRLGHVGFHGKFPAKYSIVGLHLGMTLAAALAAQPGLAFVGEEAEYGIASYAAALDPELTLTARFRRDALIGLDLERPQAVYPSRDVWTPAPAGFYPQPIGLPGEPFADPNLKLVVLNALLDAGTIDLGDPESLAMHVLGHVVDLEADGWEFSAAAYAYLACYPLTAVQLATVDALSFDGGSEIYRYVWYHWDGESDEFTVRSLGGLGHCPNVRSFDETALLDDDDLTALVDLPLLEEVGLGPGLHHDAEALTRLPKLRRLTCYTSSLDDPAVLMRLRERGVDVTEYD